jgi:hypothetical protein
MLLPIVGIVIFVAFILAIINKNVRDMMYLFFHSVYKN